MVTKTGFIGELPELVNLKLNEVAGAECGYEGGMYNGYLRAVSKMHEVPVSNLDDIVCELAELATVEE